MSKSYPLLLSCLLSGCFYKKTTNTIAITNIFPVVERLRQEDLEGEVELGSIMKHCLKKKIKQKQNIFKIYIKYILAVLEEELDYKTEEEALLDKPCI